MCVYKCHLCSVEINSESVTAAWTCNCLFLTSSKRGEGRKRTNSFDPKIMSSSTLGLNGMVAVVQCTVSASECHYDFKMDWTMPKPRSNQQKTFCGVDILAEQLSSGKFKIGQLLYTLLISCWRRRWNFQKQTRSLLLACLQASHCNEPNGCTETTYNWIRKIKWSKFDFGFKLDRFFVVVVTKTHSNYYYFIQFLWMNSNILPQAVVKRSK